jgi:hypothetical protein
LETNIDRADRHVSKAPTSGLMHYNWSLFDHLVGARKQRRAVEQARIKRPSSSQPDEFGHLQKSLNLPGDNSVYRTVCWMLRWPR